MPRYGGKNWRKIADCIAGRTPIQCLHRWTKILQPGLIKGPWILEEDRKLVDWVKNNGPNRWSQCSENIKGRSGKQCRERWCNSLNPKVVKGNWTLEEDFKIFILYKHFQGKWSRAANVFVGRTENSIKNRFYSSLRKATSIKKKGADDAASLSEGLTDLIKYFNSALSDVQTKFMKSQGFTEEAVKRYERDLIESLNRQCPSTKSECQFKVEKDDTLTSNLSQSKQTPSTSFVQPQQQTINVNVNFNTNEANNYIINNPIHMQQQTNPFQFDNMAYMNPYACPPNNGFGFNNTMQTYKNMDIYSLQQGIYDMCDDPCLMLNDHGLMNFDNQIDSMIENLFNKNNIMIGLDSSKDCNACEGDSKQMQQNNHQQHNTNKFAIPQTTPMNQANNNTVKIKADDSKNKKDQLQSLLGQLNDLEKMVKKLQERVRKI